MNRNQILADSEVPLDKTLLNQVANEVEERAKKLRERAVTALRAGRVAAKTTDTWVHDHPWSAIGMAAGVGCFVGWLIARR